jgi:hypothetical protein
MTIEKDELISFLKSNFSLTLKDGLPDSDSAFFQALQKELAIRIEKLINYDMEKLLWILYRIDIDKKLTDEAFSLGEVKAIANALSLAIIQRQLRKLEYRRKFQQEE